MGGIAKRTTDGEADLMSANSISVEPTKNSIQIETFYAWSDYYFLSPCQVLPEHKEVGT